MSTIDEFLAGLDEPVRTVFERIRTVAVEEAPDATQGTSYGMPALVHRGKGLLGFRVAAKHLSVFPFSGTVVDELGDTLAGLDVSKGTVRFGVDAPPSDDVVRALVRARIREIEKA